MFAVSMTFVFFNKTVKKGCGILSRTTCSYLLLEEQINPNNNKHNISQENDQGQITLDCDHFLEVPLHKYQLNL